MKKPVTLVVSCLVVLFSALVLTPAANAQRKPLRIASAAAAPTTYMITSGIDVDPATGQYSSIPRTIRVADPSMFAAPAGSTTMIIQSPQAGLTFNLTFDDAGMSGAGLSAGDIASVHTAAAYVATQFTAPYNDPIHVNITITAAPGGLGSSSTLLGTTTYAALRAAIVLDSKSTDDAATLLGSVPLVDPIPGATYWVIKAQRKALGMSGDDLTTDGTFTFASNQSYTYDSANRAVAGKFDWIGVAEHEFSEIMGRIGLMGATVGALPNSYDLMDLYSYTGPNTRGLTSGGGRSFSIDNGTTLLKAFNNAVANGGDMQDWASGTNDAYNAFSNSGVQNGISAVDIRVMDVLGYDRTITTAANVNISGRVVDRYGSGVRNARVTIADSRGNTFSARTNSFGYYTFASVPSGDTYIANASARGMVFATRVTAVNDAVADLNFSPQ